MKPNFRFIGNAGVLGSSILAVSLVWHIGDVASAQYLPAGVPFSKTAAKEIPKATAVESERLTEPPIVQGGNGQVGNNFADSNGNIVGGTAQFNNQQNNSNFQNNSNNVYNGPTPEQLQADAERRRKASALDAQCFRLAQKLANKWAQELEVLGYKNAIGSIMWKDVDPQSGNVVAEIAVSWEGPVGGDSRSGRVTAVFEQQKDGSLAVAKQSRHDENARLRDVSDTVATVNFWGGVLQLLSKSGSSSGQNSRANLSTPQPRPSSVRPLYWNGRWAR